MHPRHLSTLLWLGLCGLLTACSASNPTPTPSLSGAELPSAALFRGQLTRLDNGEGRFTPCQSQESCATAEPAFWQRWAQMGNPAQLYAELEGQLTPSAERGRASGAAADASQPLEQQSAGLPTPDRFCLSGHRPPTSLEPDPAGGERPVQLTGGQQLLSTQQQPTQRRRSTDARAKRSERR